MVINGALTPSCATMDARFYSTLIFIEVYCCLKEIQFLWFTWGLRRIVTLLSTWGAILCTVLDFSGAQSDSCTYLI